LLSLILAVLPDVDFLAFSAGIPYWHRWGHRGISHSFFMALVVSLLLALATSFLLGVPWWRLWLFLALVAVSHTLLDAMTDGGLGVAWLSPFSEHRYFLPFRPIRVSPVGWAAFSARGWEALVSEFFWVWIPLVTAVVMYHFRRWF
jgi:inner membrane protein